ncbi:MAG: carbohydrate ABC transporter permease [Anaerolineae bacterium]|nr:carbohydrate ABC transporter permease [Anaerolineae bacterium]
MNTISTTERLTTTTTSTAAIEPKPRRHTYKYLLFLFILIMALLWLVPVAMMIIVSLTPPDQRSAQFGGLLIKGVSLANYETVFNDAPILRHFANSLIVTVPSVFLVVMVSSLAAFAFSRMRFVAKELLFFLLIVTLMLPIPTLIIPLFQINRSLGLFDNYLGLILPYTALGVPFAMIILRSFFDSFPKEIEEAAILDGCSQLDVYRRIMMPVSLPALSVVIIWQFMTSWNEFIVALVTMDTTALKPLTLVPLIYSGQFMARPGVMFAVLTLITVPVILVYYTMQRYMIRGLTAGALKG